MVLRKKIDRERDASHGAGTPTSPDVAEFQKAQIRVSPNDQRSTRRRVLVVLANEPPRVGATDSKEARRIQGNADRAQRQVEEQRQAIPPCARDLRLEFEEAGLLTFNKTQAKLGAAMARLQQSSPSSKADTAMAYLQVATALVEEKSTTSKSAASSRADIRVVDPIDLRIASSPPSRRKSTNPQRTLRPAPTYAPTSIRIGVVAVDGPYNKDLTVKTSGSRGVYNKFHADLLY
jgi:hypothetical protein